MGNKLNSPSCLSAFIEIFSCVCHLKTFHTIEKAIDSLFLLMK